MNVLVFGPVIKQQFSSEKICPPMVIQKGQRVQQYWTEGSKPGVTLAAAQKVYITKHKFHLNSHWFSQSV